ncbi:MAG TPA: hypothetical protein VG406_21590 [Isosphaeraceae bacterium]|jgi:hypothetical protein|nr:hypothetical protein [Isosphaeraceae bacterium]
MHTMVKRLVLVAPALLVVGLHGGPARGQLGMSGGRRSLGGYGAATIGSYYSTTSGGFAPYNGRAGGFVPFRGDSLGVQPSRRPTTPIGGASAVGMATSPATAGVTMDRRPPMFRPLYGPMSDPLSMGMGRMARSPLGPGLGYPFTMPPVPSGGVAGGMAMP